MSLIEKAHKLAIKARERAYSPYSKFKVGAAVKAVGSDKIYIGCNVENSSFGATVCAERIAIFNMISDIGEQKIEFLLLVTDSKKNDYPCGLCLQVMSEFVDPETPVYLANLEKVNQAMKFSELMPQPFDKNSFV